MTERKWNNKFYHILQSNGISEKACGASSHGLRHAYAQNRYYQLTGFNPPVKFKDKDAFRVNAEKIAGDAWKTLDEDARLIIKGELGHGPDRNDIVSQYLGAK